MTLSVPSVGQEALAAQGVEQGLGHGLAGFAGVADVGEDLRQRLGMVYLAEAAIPLQGFARTVVAVDALGRGLYVVLVMNEGRGGQAV